MGQMNVCVKPNLGGLITPTVRKFPSFGIVPLGGLVVDVDGGQDAAVLKKVVHDENRVESLNTAAPSRKIRLLYPNMTAENWTEMRFGPYSVTEIEHFVYHLSDGTPIAMKMWLPTDIQNDRSSIFHPFLANVSNVDYMNIVYPGPINQTTRRQSAAAERFPVILEYLPYCKDHFTAKRDRRRHGWFSSHGYVSIRPDMRGSCVSGGYLRDEYAKQEQIDAAEIIGWIAGQSWSNGRVGMYGKSWGGFNGLQLAYDQPPALKTAISLYSTDDRYTDDVHYMGGTVVGNAMVSWASQMFLWNSRPPLPRFFVNNASSGGEVNLTLWKAHWLDRLEKSSESWLTLPHITPFYRCCREQTRNGSYWSQGSVNEDIDRVKIPILAIGGLVDGYTNAALRMAGTLNAESRVLIGPWSHDWPDTSIPGPRIDFLGECLRWWNAHLKQDTDSLSAVSTLPRLRLFLRDAHEPKSMMDNLPGRFISLPDYVAQYKNYIAHTDSRHQPGSNLSAGKQRHPLLTVFHLNGTRMSLSAERPAANASAKVELKPDLYQGVKGGGWLAWGRGSDLPGDQRESNSKSVCFTTEPLKETLILSGMASARLHLWAKAKGDKAASHAVTRSFYAVDLGRYSIAVRLSHIRPGGQATRISYGLQNLAHWKGNKRPEMHFPGHENHPVTIDLTVTAYTVPKDHRISLCMSPTYFPLLYTPGAIEGLFVVTEGSYVIMESLPAAQLVEISMKPPNRLLSSPIRWLRPSTYDFSVEEMREKTELVFHMIEDRGKIHFLEKDFMMEERVNEIHSISFPNQEYTYVLNVRQAVVNFPKYENMTVTVGTTNYLYSTLSDPVPEFTLEESLNVQIDEETFYQKTWSTKIPRSFA